MTLLNTNTKNLSYFSHEHSNLLIRTLTELHNLHFDNRKCHLRITLIQKLLDGRKVTSKFQYFLQILAPEFVLVLKIVVLNAKLNSTSNGDISNGGSSDKNGKVEAKYWFFPIFLIYPANIHFYTCADCESGCNGWRIKFYVEW